MRFTTYEAQMETIVLSEEIRYINAYIELEQLRHYEKDFVSWQMTISDDSRQIPPYLLSPLVENALKHGAFSSSDPIQMQLSDDRQLTFTISNTIADKKKDSLGGIGLENLRNRLEILYPGAYNLETKTDGNRFSAYLQIPL